ncbi:hypothetical protein HPP92_012962 [Vanilla planifolia]|uniref:Nuclear pore complex protein GP210 n=1 Tax=Vanilla planifolia TaxID=51239 RepID=A0A835QUR5_VANPL|nr:hypothetical protein HPP92_012962 [Vanilla planifolia]
MVASPENLFSSLVGLPVSWELIPKSLESNNIHHLIHVPLKETPLSDCVSGFCGDLDIQVKLEERGLGADLYVVKGVEIGHEIVKAKLLEPTLEHVEDKVTITIAEAMSLDPPSPVFVTVGAVIYYCLKIIHQNSSRVIELPSPHHQWSVHNSSVARVDSMMGIVRALQLGMTNVIVEDIRVYGHLQTSALHVVLPEKLSLFLVPVTSSFDLVEGVDLIHSANVWYVFLGQTYIINMKVFSEGPDVNEILVTKDTDLMLEGNNFDFWDIMPVPTNATEKYGWKNSRLFKPYAVGEGVLTAFLFYLSETKEESLKAVQKIAVCSQVKFSIREKLDSVEVIRIPWAPGVYQQAQLTAVGGCGKLLWLSSDDSTVSVSASGLILARRPGRSTVKVVSAFDLLNYDEVVVEIMIPSSMNVLPFYPVEAEVGTELTAAVTLKTFDGNLFYQCDAFNSFIRWSVVSKSKTFKALNATGNTCEGNMLALTESYKQSYGQPCAWACLLAHGTGRAMLHATFSIESHSPLYSIDGAFILETAFPIAAYTPLVAYQAGDGNKFGGYWIDIPKIDNFIEDSCSTGLDELYLVPGSAMDVHLCGGPDRWDQHVKYIETVEVVSEQDEYMKDGIQVQRRLSAGRRSYQIVCVSLGKFKLLFSQGNLVGVDHPIASIAKLELFIVCSFPSSITIVTNQPANTHDIIEAAAKADRGPDLVRTCPIIVANGCTIRIAAVGLHSKIKAFANSSSLCLSWELVGCEDLAYWSENESCKSSNNNNWERSLVLRNTSGLCTIRAAVTGFSDAVLGHFFRKEYLQLESLKSMLTDAFRLQLVTSLRVVPESVLLIFDPEAKVNLSISGGTCLLDAVTNDTKVAQISVTDCSHLLLSPRGLGVTLVTIRDIGLYPPSAAYALAKVSNVEWIRIVCEEEITLMEGTIRDFELIAGSDDGSIFDSSQYAFLQIQIHLVDQVLHLFDNNISSISTVGLKFSIRAAAVGITTFYASVRQRGAHERLSQIVKVEVYKPLQVYPDYIYLAPGASYVVTAKGGPIIGDFVEFASLDEETAAVHSSSGKLSAIFTGNAVIRAAVYGKAGNLICEAFGRVEVGIPSQMILSSQSGKLCIGCKMPIYPSISQGSLFSFYELCKEFKWMVDNEKVVELEDARILSSDTEEPCYSDDSYIGFINTLFGRSSGTAEVSISFSCDFQLSGTTKTVQYASSRTLTVMCDPPLALGMPVTWVLPPSYMTSDLLPGSIESYGPLDVHYRRKGIIFLVLRTCESKQHPITMHGGKIKTGNVNDLACIQGKDQTTERIEIASCIRVSEVAQVRVSVAKSSFHSAYIGINGRLELVINYCDELGYSFAEANGAVPFNVEINRPDVVSVQLPDAKNITSKKILLQARSQGRALARILINHNPEKADFILI